MQDVLHVFLVYYTGFPVAEDFVEPLRYHSPILSLAMLVLVEFLEAEQIDAPTERQDFVFSRRSVSLSFTSRKPRSFLIYEFLVRQVGKFYYLVTI